jgi:murein L,D-transpeptidase YafK
LILIKVKSQNNYINTTRVSSKNTEIISRIEDSLSKVFELKKIAWPPVSVYLRSFKYNKELELWIKSDAKSTYKLFNTYKICMQSGTMGPKRVEGDYQVPEGFYYINDFNAFSNYHLSLGLNYPNASDKILSDNYKPGGSIYIHGNCVSTGCIAINDKQIEEVFAIADAAKNNGEEFIPVHVFPVRYSDKLSFDYLSNAIKEDESLIKFNKNLREVFDYFELKKTIPIILVNKKGEYVLH